MAIPAGRNGAYKEAETKQKYTNLCTETQRMIIPVTTAASGMETKGLKKTVKVIAVKRSKDSLQKTAIMGTSHIIRKSNAV